MRRRKRRQEQAEEPKSFSEKLRAYLSGESWWDTLREGFEDGLIEFAKQNASVLALAVYSIARATAVTVKSGSTGLLFSFGRARKEIPPGLRFLIPFLQIVKTVPTRQRTLDLPAQRVTTNDGLVFLVDANLVYQVVDIKKALIEIDDLVKGMRQVLVLSVQEVLRGSQRETLRVAEETDHRLSDAMAARLEPWGVKLIHAGFTSITPSPTTLKLVQLGERVSSRRKGLELLEPELGQSLALALLGTPQRFSTRARVLREREVGRRRLRHLRRELRLGIARSGLVLSPKEKSRLRHETRAFAGFGGVLGDSGSRSTPSKATA